MMSSSMELGRFVSALCAIYQVLECCSVFYVSPRLCRCSSAGLRVGPGAKGPSPRAVRLRLFVSDSLTAHKHKLGSHCDPSLPHHLLLLFFFFPRKLSCAHFSRSNAKKEKSLLCVPAVFCCSKSPVAVNQGRAQKAFS